MRRKGKIARGISWLLVSAMLVTGMVPQTGALAQATSAEVETASEENDTLEEITEETTEGTTTEEQTEQQTENVTEKETKAVSRQAARALKIVKSPIVDVENHAITFNLNASSGAYATAKEVLLRGDVIDDWDVGQALTKQDDVFSLTLENVNPGVYTYKYVVDGTWITDPHNAKTLNGNSVVYVPGLAAPSADIALMKDTEKSLPTTLKKYDSKGNFENVDVTYSVPEEYQDQITLDGYRVSVHANVGERVAVTAKDAEGNTASVKLSVVEEIYTYNIYYHDFEESRMATDQAQLWLWEYKKSTGVAEDFDEVVDINGEKWLKASLELSYTDVAMIARSYGDWKWQNSSKGMVYYNTEKKGEVNLYVVSGSKTIYEDIPNLESLRPRQRYVVVEYDREQKDYEDWNIYTWNSGYEETIALEQAGGKQVAKVQVMDSTADMNLGFIMRRSTADNAWAEKDGGDNYLTVPADQSVLKVQFVQGKGVVSTTPDNIGYRMDGEADAIHFYYRDDALYLNYELDSLKDKVSVVIDGEEHPMAYDAENERFSYDLKGLTSGQEYTYYYLVDGNRVLDKFNDQVKTDENGEQYNVCTYYHFDMNITASLSLKEMDYNQNNVLTVHTNFANDKETEGFQVKQVTCDLSALGGNAAFAIEPELLEGTISVTDTVKTGEYEIPVKMVDIYGNEYKTSVTVKVKDRVKAEGDFDWDEAVVYFAVTDRFFDGDTSNNDAYGVGDYNTSTSTGTDGGGSCYHGGDFAGLTQKLDYLKDLGVNTIWITPIVENITQDLSSTEGLSAYGYHGYWASDFTKLNRHLGTDEQFRALLDAAHARGMKLMVDIVVNHAGYDTEDYFNSIIKDKDGNPVAMVRDDATTIDGDTVRDSLSGLPDFVTENADVRNQLVQWQVDWVKKYDIDYYRVDTVKHVEHTTWAALKNELTKENPEFKMIGEYSGAGYASTGGELSTGSMDALLDFDFNDFAQSFVTGNMEGIESTLVKRNASINNTATLGSFIGSHDEDGLLFRLCSDGENGSGLPEEQARNLYKVAASLQLTAKGIPVIYYNEEIGLTGEDNYPYQTNRQDFDWEEEAKQEKQSDSMLNHYKKLLAIRNQYTDVFAKGTRDTIEVSDEKGYDLTSRSYQGQTVYLGLNVKDADAKVTFKVDGKAGDTYEDLYGNTLYKAAADGTITVTIPKAAAGGTLILVKSDKSGKEDENKPDSGKPGTTTEDKTESATAQKVSKITVSGISRKLAAGKKVSLQATVLPENAANKGVTWSSSNTKYATVTADGKVSLKKAGAGKRVTITATAKDGSGVKAVYEIQIMKHAVKSIKLKANAKKVQNGKSVKVRATVKTTGKKANKKLKWTSSNTKYATVNSKGVVKTKKAGKGKKVKITATATDGSGKKKSITIKIK